MISRLPPEVVLENHRRWEERQREGMGDRPNTLNVGPALYLTDPTRYPFRGRMWRVPPVSLDDGIRVMDVLQRLGRLEKSKDIVAEYRDIMRDALAVIRRCVLPHRGRLRRLLWRARLLPNPWRTASHLEVGEILGFFWKLRTSGPDPSPLHRVSAKPPTS